MKNSPNNTAETIAKNVRNLRKNMNLSQEEFAGAAEIDRTYASQIERAVAKPSLAVLCRIAEVLNVELRELLD